MGWLAGIFTVKPVDCPQGPVESWGQEEVLQWLKSKKLGHFVSKFAKVDGSRLLSLGGRPEKLEKVLGKGEEVKALILAIQGLAPPPVEAPDPPEVTGAMPQQEDLGEAAAEPPAGASEGGASVPESSQQGDGDQGSRNSSSGGSNISRDVVEPAAKGEEMDQTVPVPTEDDQDLLRKVFEAYVAPCSEITNVKLRQMARESGIVEGKLSMADVDFYFVKAKPKSKQRLDYKQFCSVLASIARKKGMSEFFLHSLIISQGGPNAKGTPSKTTPSKATDALRQSIQEMGSPRMSSSRAMTPPHYSLPTMSKKLANTTAAQQDDILRNELDINSPRPVVTSKSRIPSAATRMSSAAPLVGRWAI